MLGVKLLVRGHRSISFTTEGERLFRRADEALKRLQEAIGAICVGFAARPVTIASSIGVAGLWLLPRLGNFLRQHPDIDVRISASNELSDLRDDELDLAIRYCPPEVAPAMATRLFVETVAPVAHPSLGLSVLHSPQELEAQILLEFDGEYRPYLWPTTERPYNYMYEPPAGTAKQNCEYRVSRVRIADARAMASPPTIHGEGFELWDAPTSMVDFRDEDVIRRHYYAEAAELAKCVTGAEHACIFDHLVRRRETGRPALSFGRQGDGSRPGAAGHVHNDYSEASGQKRFEIVALDHEVRSRTQRFGIANIWRPIRGKVMDTPLAVCDARTISAKDLVATDILYPDRSKEIYLVQETSRHQWAYFSEMDSHEALVFKQYDSRVNGVARFTPHSAFDLPDIPPDAPLGESIEIRCLVTYG